MRPDAFAAVMATGIVSIAFADHGLGFVSVPLAVVATVALPVLAVLAAGAWRREGWTLRDADTAIGLLTYVCACCVLAARFHDHRWAVVVLGGLALQGWVSLAPFVVRDLWRLRWTGLRDHAHGGWLLASVATSGLTIVFVAFGSVFWACVFWPLALLAYVVLAGLVGWRAVHDPSVRRNVPPDHWILMGASSIATLAGAHLHDALYPGPIADGVRVVTIVTWAIASALLVPLALLGWRRVRDWPAIFPLGMYSAATYAVGLETGWSGLREVSLAFACIALVVWLLTLPRFRRGRRRSPPLSAPESRG